MNLKFAQLLIVKHESFDIEEVELRELSSTARDGRGFGSTGHAR